MVSSLLKIMGTLLNFCVTNLLREKKMELKNSSWVGLRLSDKAMAQELGQCPLVLLPGPHNELLSMPGCISHSSSARARPPRFLGSWALCPSQPPWLFLLDLE